MSDERLRGLAENRPRNVLSILAVLHAREATGVLRFEPAPDPEYVVEFLFRNGKLLFSTTNRPGVRTGEFLVRRNVLSSERATVALLEARRSGKLFHGYLVDKGLLEREILQVLLYERTEELLHTVLQSKDGRFVVEDSQLRRFDRHVPAVDEELFARMLTYRNLWLPAFEKLSNGRPILRGVHRFEAAPALQALSEADRRILQTFAASQPVQRWLEGRRDRVELTIRLAQFLESGLLEVVAQDTQQADATQPLEATEPSADRLSGKAGQMAGAAPSRPPEPPEPDTTSIDLELSPALAPEIELGRISTLGLTMDDLFVLSQIDGRTSLRQLISITGVGEKPLFRLMHHVIRLGYAELRPRQVLGPPVRSIRPPSRVTSAPPKPQAAPAPEPPRTQSEPKKPTAPDGQVAEPRPRVAHPPIEPKDAAFRLHARAVAAYNAQNFAAAEELLRCALKLDAGSSVIRARLGLVLAEQPERVKEAQRMIQEALDEDPLEGHCLEAMGLFKARLGDYAKAWPLLETALLLERHKVPSSARILEELKGYQARKGEKPEELWPRIRKLIRLIP